MAKNVGAPKRKKNPGPPPRADQSTVRKKLLGVRLTAPEAAKMERLATKHRMTASALVQQWIQDAKE